MPVFPDADALYSVLRTTFTRLARESPDRLDGLKSLIESKMVLQLQTSSPAAQVTLNAREKGFQAIYGPSTVRPDLVVVLSADTLHRVLMHELSIKRAWSAGQIKAKGPIWKLQVLTGLIKGARQYYPQVVQEQKAAKP
ncbi:MAG: hypothetical protein ACM3JD_06130, partial [Rudaea sp.]